jgi:hypothetical protein
VIVEYNSRSSVWGLSLSYLYIVHIFRIATCFRFYFITVLTSNRVAIAFTYYYMSIKRIEKKEMEQMSRHLGVD